MTFQHVMEAVGRHGPIAAALVIVSAVYWSSLDLYFHGDDFVAFVGMAIKPWDEHLWSVFTFGDGNFYWRPLGQVYYLAIYKIWGLDPVAYHAANLALFLITLFLTYLFVLRAGLSKPVALLAVLILGVTPAHVIGVAWVTNAARLLALAFFMGSMLMVQRAAETHRLRDEAAAWLLCLAAGLSEETALALAPVPALYAFAAAGGWGHLRSTVVRGFAYASFCAVLVPLQFTFTLDDEPRLSEYGIGPHMAGQLWALAGRLALPLDTQGLMTAHFNAYPSAEWIAGAALGAVALAAFVFGGRMARLLVVWGVLGLLPFTLWDMPVASSRYVYYAAVPYAILLAWLVVGLAGALGRVGVPRAVWTGVAFAACAPALFLGAEATIDRHAAWRVETEPYRVIATQFPKAVPELKDDRVIVYYSIWKGWDLWPASVLRVLYKKPNVQWVSIPRGLVDSDFKRDERIGLPVFYTGEGFIAPVPRTGQLNAR